MSVNLGGGFNMAEDSVRKAFYVESVSADWLRWIAYKEKRHEAEILREALQVYIDDWRKKNPDIELMK